MDVYQFSEQECLYWRVSHDRFQEILKNEGTLIHEIKDSNNNYGEFLFITTSRQGNTPQERVCMTFYGLGYHEYRERWITDEWFWFQANAFPELIRQKIDKEAAQALIEERLDAISQDSHLDTQTERGKLFEMLADLTDEDGALAEMEDLGEDWEQLLGDQDA